MKEHTHITSVNLKHDPIGNSGSGSNTLTGQRQERVNRARKM